MKKIIGLVVIIIIFIVTLIFHNDIVNFLVNNLPTVKKQATKLENNTYASSNDFNYVKLTNDFFPKNKGDIRNIYYTILNSGLTDFIFYCDKSYSSCLEDVNFISNNQKVLSSINNFVPVFNSFQNIETEFDSLGKITVHITHTYNDDEIEQINQKADKIIEETITTDMDNETKIKAIHDYIINHTKYDTDRSDNNINTYNSDNAYGALIQGYAVCGGYADSMKIFLDRFKIPNFKVSSENHIWNVVYLNNEWLHLDLTWDDPVTSSGEDTLDYSFFLINTDELLEQEKEQHIFDYDIYKELKKASRSDLKKIYTK